MAGVATTLGALFGCSGRSDEEVETYTALEGIYALQGVDRYWDACTATGDAESVAAPPFWVAYLVRNGVPNPQLQATGCAMHEACRAIAADVQMDGELDTRTFYDLLKATYSRLESNGKIGGVGLVIEPVNGECALNLRQFGLERRETRTDFLVTTRAGTRYPMDADGKCPKRPDLEAHWAEWQDGRCLTFEVIRTEFEAAL